MRRPITLIKPDRQQGYALFIVLMMMVVIALLVVTATQSYNTEQRISTNDADRKLATTLAEATLREGENQIFDIEGKKTTFTAKCEKGLCSTPNVKSNDDFTEEGNPTVDAWKRKCDKSLCIDANGTEYPLDKKSGIVNNPRYIIEYLGKTTEGQITYRVTAKAWGKNANTQVVLQSYVASE